VAATTASILTATDVVGSAWHLLSKPGGISLAGARSGAPMLSVITGPARPRLGTDSVTVDAASGKRLAQPATMPNGMSQQASPTSRRAT